MSELKGRKLVLGVTGGVAAYKAAELVRLLGKAGADVHVVLTEGGARFVTAVTFQALSGNPVWTDLWDPRMGNNMAHIDLTRDADAILIAPATADVMAKLVHGLADDLLTTLCLARDCPLLVAPAMNRQMWESPPTQRTIVAQQFEDAGFSNITLTPIEDLKFGIITKDGEVEKVTVSGNEEYVIEKWYRQDVPINIYYHTFEPEK